MQKEVAMKLLRFSLSALILTLAMLLPAQAQQEVMPDIFDPIPPERVVPVSKASAKDGIKPSARARAKHMSAKGATMKTTGAARTTGAPKPTPALRPVETARGR
jgi:hypothetical protein